MAKQKTRVLQQVRIEAEVMSIRVSQHAEERMAKREVDEYVVAGAVLAMGKRLLQIESGDEFAVIDEDHAVTVIAGKTGNTITIITVIDKSNVFVKKGTKVHNV